MRALAKSVALCVALLLPVLASAQTSDTQYCSALASETRRVVGTGSAPDAVSVAMTQCNSSPASAIPVLEKHLKDNKVTLPKR